MSNIYNKKSNVYEDFFVDCIEYRLEELNKKVPRKIINLIVEKIIYKDEIIWEYINNTIDLYIEKEMEIYGNR